MRLEYYPVEKLKKEILEIVANHLDVNKYRVFFFGSRVTGKGDEHSDIDIGIEGSKPVSFKIMAQIQEEVSDLPILYRIDIVDFKNVDKDFYEVAKQSFELIGD